MAILFGFLTAYITFIIASNLFRDYPIIWWIYMCEGYEAALVVFGTCGVVACALVLVKWIKGEL